MPYSAEDFKDTLFVTNGKIHNELVQVINNNIK